MADILQVKIVVETNFPQVWLAVETCMSVINVLFLKDNASPIGLNLIGPPSSSKTIVLSFFKSPLLDDLIFSTDNFTPKSFVSHAVNVKEEDLKNIDLLPKIKDKCIVVSELAPMLCKRNDDLMENVAIFTRIFDGKGYESDSGLRGHRGYVGNYNFCWLGASTPFPPNVWMVMGRLGHRWFFYNMPLKKVSNAKLIDIVHSKVSFEDKINNCKMAIAEFYEELKNKHKINVHSIVWDNSKDDLKVIYFIINCSHLLKRLRASLMIWDKFSVDNEKVYEYQPPLIEESERMVQSLYNIARGRAVLYGRNYLIEEDCVVVADVVLSSMPDDRLKIFRVLMDCGGSVTNEVLAEKLGCSTKTSQRMMYFFENLGVAKVSQEGILNSGGFRGNSFCILTLNDDLVKIVDELKLFSSYYK